MKNPDETINNLKSFASRIDSEYYRMNFLFSDGYFKFIQDLAKITVELHKSCERILQDGKQGTQSTG
jgi:hypothetical protein